MNLNDLKEKRAANVTEMRTIRDKDAPGENETKKFDELLKDTERLDVEIRNEEKVLAFERTIQTNEPNGDPSMQHELRSYSVVKAIRESGGERLTGLEAEVHSELSKGRAEVRGVMVPTSYLFDGETRAMTTDNNPAGGYLVARELGEMSDHRRPALKIQALGATIMSGLTGDLDLPHMKTSGSAFWIGEHKKTTRSDPSFSKKSMFPRTVSGEYEMSRKMLLQSSIALEPMVRRDLGFIIAQGVDSVAIKGGGANEPIGIMSDDTVTQMSGAAINLSTAADMIAELEMDDVTGTRAFLTHPGVLKIARKIQDGDGLPIPLATTFHKERLESSTQVPVVTAGSPDTYSLIYGEWASLYIGYWSGVDLLLNPYHSDVASKGGSLLHAFLDTDVVVRHSEAFRWLEVTG